MREDIPGRFDIRDTAGTLGTFAGVFTPSVLTILGIILFLRLGFVVGNAGIRKALLIIALANAISILTTISLSAIATNLKIKGGGDYYLISRTLGVEFGGAIGVVLFMAQSVSIAFYCIGFGEVVSGMVSAEAPLLPQAVAALAVSFLFVFAWLGADWATRLQYVIMALIGTALLSFFLGGMMRFEWTILAANWSRESGGLSFWAVFAVFFPAVTGFTQGVSMSGDLKDPGRSLPLGTFTAVGISMVIYFMVALLLAGALPGEYMRNNYGAMNRVATVSILINIGVVAATLSSAMASFLGAPRILQSMARDRTFTFIEYFAKGEGPGNNPRRGVILSGCIALATVSIGKLNLIAPIVSMFFLVSYGLLNYATFYEARSKSPSFRPTFRWFDFRVSLLGAAGCLAVMVAIDIFSSLVAISVLFSIYQYLKRTATPARWADSRRAYHFQQVRNNLLAVPSSPEHPRDWRPQILAFSDDPERRKRLLYFASWIEGGSGITTAVRILEGKGKKIYELRDRCEAEMIADVAAYKGDAFAKVIAVPEFRAGAQALIQSFGIGPIKANTILMNGPEQVSGTKGQRQYGRYLAEAVRLGCNVLVLNNEEEAWAAMENKPSRDRRVDIWWQDDMTGRLMLLLAYLMTRTEEWKDAKLRVMVSTHGSNTSKKRENFRSMLEELRIDAELKMVKRKDIRNVARHSGDAAMVFLPFHLSKRGPVGPYGIFLGTVFSHLPLVVLVIAAEDIQLDAEPEEGKVAEVAASLDDVAVAEKEAANAEKAVLGRMKAIKGLKEELAAFDEREDSETVKKLKKSLLEAKRAMAKDRREAVKARREAERAAEDAAKMTGIALKKSEEPGEEAPPSSVSEGAENETS